MSFRDKLKYSNPYIFAHGIPYTFGISNFDKLFDLTEFIVGNIKGLRHLVANIKGLDYELGLQRLDSFVNIFFGENPSSMYRKHLWNPSFSELSLGIDILMLRKSFNGWINKTYSLIALWGSALNKRTIGRKQIHLHRCFCLFKV